jgi:hypothetical protein
MVGYPDPPLSTHHPTDPVTFDSVLFPEPFLPMMACTSPFRTVIFTPFKICCPVDATLASRSLTSRITSPEALHSCDFLNLLTFSLKFDRRTFSGRLKSRNERVCCPPNDVDACIILIYLGRASSGYAVVSHSTGTNR